MSGRFPVVNSKQLLTALLRAGFFIDRIKASHYYLKHRQYQELRVSLPYHNKDLRRGTIKNVLLQANLTPDELAELLNRKRAA
jgi:predicted RNA binding protein YcfA (HicA-like mRNA interferase family)